MFEVLLGYSQGAKNSYLTMGICSKDTATRMDLVTVGCADSGLKERTQYIKERKLVEMSGLLHFDLVNLGPLLSNGLPLEIVLHRQGDSFEEAQLCV